MKQMAANIMKTNPQAAAFMNAMQNQCGNMNPRDFALNLCRENGIPDFFTMALANSMGLK